MATEHPDIQAIFNEAIGLPTEEERRQYLDKACGSDLQARARVEALLRAHAEAGGFLGGESPAADETPIATERPGTVIGPYKLLEQIGEGSFGLVFMVEQSQPVRRKVALKILKPGMDTRQVVARFEAERQALAIMDHPNIAKIFDGGATPSGRPYFVMELVKGFAITEFCDQNRLTARERLELFLPICQAVQHAHQKGIIHRDLKPANILVTMHDTKPVVKVIDFGIAKALGQELTEKTMFTGFSQMVGTLLYMSPEQAGQSGLDVDTRSDIYSLGVLLYELLTGTTPFDKSRLGTAAYDEVRRIIREEEPLKPSTRLSTLGASCTVVSANRRSDPRRLRELFRGELDWIVMKSLEKDRNRRYESASSFASDVERYLNDEHVLACPPSASYLLRKFVRRNKGPVLTASLVVLSLVGGIIGTSWSMLRATKAEANAVNQANQRQIALTEKADALSDAEDKLFVSLVNQARAERSSGRVGHRFSALKAIREAAQIRITPELQSEAAAALVLSDLEPALEWEGWPEDSVQMTFDAELKRYARLERQGGLTICRLREGREEVIIRLPAHGKPLFGALRMSPDGRFVAYGHSSLRVGVLGGVRIWKLDGSVPTVVLDEPDGVFESALAFHPSGRQLAIGHADKTVSVYDLPSGRRVQRLAVRTEPYHLAFHPSDSRLAVSGGNAVQLFNTETGAESPALRHPETVTWTHSVAWHPDGRRLAVGCNDRKIRVWDTETSTEVMTPWTDSITVGVQMAFNRAGDRLVSTDWSQSVLWDAVSGQPLLRLPDLIGVQFSLDDRLLAARVNGNSTQLWRLANDRGRRSLRGRNADDELDVLMHPVLHADGRTLAACTARSLTFFDLVSGEELAALRLPRAGAAFPVFFDPLNHSHAENQKTRGEGVGGWVTAGRSGLFLWPTRQDFTRPKSLIVGPPQQLALDLAFWSANGTSASADGRVVAVPQDRSTVVLHRTIPERRVVLGPQFDVRFTAVSPDGSKVFTGSHWEEIQSTSARIWNAESGKLLHEFTLEGSTTGRFSPDGLWLMTTTPGAGCRLWEADTWREVRRFNHASFAFSPDSRLVAIGDELSTIRLVETTTGREVARLTGPEPTSYQPYCFTADGTRLISTGSVPSALYVWDLRLLRQQLKELDLDWDWPEFLQDRSTPQSVTARQLVIHPDSAEELLKNEKQTSVPEPEKNNSETPPQPRSTQPIR